MRHWTILPSTNHESIAGYAHPDLVFGGHRNLPEALRLMIEDRRHLVAVSAASLWEMTIKISIGKLELMDDLATIEATLLQQGIRILPIQTAHLQRLLSLPFHHRDPFDRLIIAQALVEDMTLVSDDEIFPLYPVALA